MLQQQIVKEMQASTDLVRKNILRIIVGEFQRCASKELTDDAVIKLLKFCIKYERILIANTKPGVDTTEIYTTSRCYLSTYLLMLMCRLKW